MIEHKLLCKAKNKQDKWIQGFFVKLREYTPSPIKDDNDKPISYATLIVRERDLDWNMPTELEFIPIKEETLCQYTGYKDKNGNLLFEHDIIQYEEPIIHTNREYEILLQNDNITICNPVKDLIPVVCLKTLDASLIKVKSNKFDEELV